MRGSIIGFKLVFGTLEIAVAVAWLAAPGAVGRAATALIPLPAAAAHPGVVAAALFALGAVKVAGAAGLWSGTAWGWRVMTASVLALLPYDAYAALPFVPVDLAILALLWHHRVALGAPA